MPLRFQRPASSCPAPDAPAPGTTQVKRRPGIVSTNRVSAGNYRYQLCCGPITFYTYGIPGNKVPSPFQHKNGERTLAGNQIALQPDALGLFSLQSRLRLPAVSTGRASYPVFQSPRSPPPPTPSRGRWRALHRQIHRSVRYAGRSSNTFSTQAMTRRSYLQ